MDVYKRIARLLIPYKRKVALGLTLQLVVILTRLAGPWLTQSVVNDVITAGKTALLPSLCAAILLLALARSVSNYARGLILERASQDVVYDMRTGLYAHLEEMPYQFYDKNRVGEIMSRMTGDIDGIRNLIAGGILTVFDNALCFIGSLVFMCFMSWQITLLLMLTTPLIALTAFQFNKRIRPAFANIREQNANLNTRVQENLAGMHVVKAFVREEHEEELFRKENRKLMELHLKASWIWSSFIPLMDLMSGLCTPIALAGGAALMAAGVMDVGTLVGVTGYIWMLTNPMRQLSNIINMLAQAATSAEKLFYYIDFGSAIRESEDARTPEQFRGHVVFDHVDFAYDGKTVLRDISFEAKPGQTVAIMGATGAGKSTLVTLLGRFYDIRSGSIQVDGVDVRKQKLKPLRRQIGYVMQDTFLFSDSVEDNIRFGRPDAAHERVAQAARVAQAEEFIEHMPGKYETIVGERGLGLSGGQKQRVAIARAVLIDPAILVLDDATSAVDMETEYLIQEDLKQVLKGRTTFIIAHRLSSVKNADQILVLDNGTIAERGTHKELLEKRGVYYDMVADQMAAVGKAV